MGVLLEREVVAYAKQLWHNASRGQTVNTSNSNILTGVAFGFSDFLWQRKAVKEVEGAEKEVKEA